MLPYTKEERKDRPLHRGCLAYFPDALAYVSHVSKVGNDQHNPGEEMHWARGKSADHGDCIVRHQAEAGTPDDDGLLHSGKVAWRALAQLQLELELEAGHNKPGILEAEAWDPRVYEERKPRFRSPRVYIAGPMRGIKDFNFPAFDRARDLFSGSRFSVISPADLDRQAPTQAATDEEAGSAGRVHEYMDRDLTDTLLTFRKSNGDAIAMLPGWEHSTGAAAEFMVAKWAGIRILDATTTEPLIEFDATALVRSVAEHLHFNNL